jgi:putative transposase
MDATLEDVTKKGHAGAGRWGAGGGGDGAAGPGAGLSLTGPDGLLKQLTKTVLETALYQEMTEHLGHESTADRIRSRGISAMGPGPTVLTESTGQVQVQVPRDRDGTFEPQIVRKRSAPETSNTFFHL